MLRLFCALAAMRAAGAWVSSSSALRSRSMRFSSWDGDSTGDGGDWSSAGGAGADSSGDSSNDWFASGAGDSSGDGDGWSDTGDQWSAWESDELDPSATAEPAVEPLEMDDETADAVIDQLTGNTVNEIVADDARERQRRRMVEAGATREQIIAFLGDDDEWAEYAGDESELEDVIQSITDGTYALDDDYIDPALIGVVDSHELVKIDTDGEPQDYVRFVFVDEPACIGCYACANVAPLTFMMEDEYGRARVMMQYGDDEQTIEEAISVCPIDCIHYVPFDELIELEKARQGQIINFKARLVGNSGLASGNGLDIMRGTNTHARVSADSGLRCSNCPGRGCAQCPMFGVGGNPEYVKKKMKKDKMKKERLKQQAREDAGLTGKTIDL